ncbi:MAG: hypothetical protein M0R66_05445 [Candidatus Omnitrophica bacterium]|nr:hypothetical protein [Candidatus Omnitrophota bacterium]
MMPRVGVRAGAPMHRRAIAPGQPIDDPAREMSPLAAPLYGSCIRTRRFLYACGIRAARRPESELHGESGGGIVPTRDPRPSPSRRGTAPRRTISTLAARRSSRLESINWHKYPPYPRTTINDLALMSATHGAVDIFAFALAKYTALFDSRGARDSAQTARAEMLRDVATRAPCPLIQFGTVINAAAKWSREGSVAQQAARVDIAMRAHHIIEEAAALIPRSQCESEYEDARVPSLHNSTGGCIFDAGAMLGYAAHACSARMCALAREWGARSFGGMFCSAVYNDWIEGCTLAYEWTAQRANDDEGAPPPDPTRAEPEEMVDCIDVTRVGDANFGGDAGGNKRGARYDYAGFPIAKRPCTRTRECGSREATFSGCGCARPRCAMFDFMNSVASAIRGISLQHARTRSRNALRIARMTLEWIGEYFARDCAVDVCNSVFVSAVVCRWREMFIVARVAGADALEGAIECATVELAMATSDRARRDYTRILDLAYSWMRERDESDDHETPTLLESLIEKLSE